MSRNKVSAILYGLGISYQLGSADSRNVRVNYNKSINSYLNKMKVFFRLTVLFILLGCSQEKTADNKQIKTIPISDTARKHLFDSTSTNNINNLQDTILFDRFKVTGELIFIKAKLKLDSLAGLPNEIIDNIQHQYNATQKANFSKQYIIVSWSCGAPCQMNAIINMKTGQVSQTINSSLGLVFKDYSNLIIINPIDSTEQSNNSTRRLVGEPQFVILKDNKLIKLK